MRVLRFSHRARKVLSSAGETCDHPYRELEKRCGDLYGLFSLRCPEAPGIEEKRRIYYRKESYAENT